MKIALGAEPLLSGFQFSSGMELQVAIRDYLISVGMSAIADDISSTGELLVKGQTNNGHECWIKFTSVIEADRQYLAIQGDYDGTDTYLSPPLELDYNLGFPNRCWLMADSDSGGIGIRNRYTYSGGIAFGFLERKDESDADAWMIAMANNRLNDAYIAKSHKGTIWSRIGDSYFNADQFSSIALNGAYQGILDFAIALPLGSFTARTTANAGFFAHTGSLNGTNNKALIARRFYLEGAEDTSNYDDDSEFEFRGYIKHFYNGFGSLPGGATFPDKAGNQYISVGGDGWQGLRIVDSENPISLPENELPVVYHNTQILNSDRLLSEVRSALASLGWVTISDLIDSSGNRTLILQGRYFEAEEYCYLNLKSFGSSGLVEIAGEFREEPEETPQLSQAFAFANITNLKISANAQAGAIAIESNGVETFLYFGFYGGRIDESDKYSWGFGKVGTDLSQMFVAKSRLTGEVWQSIGAQFNTALGSRSSFPANGIGDRLSIPLFPLDYFDNSDPRNSARKLSKENNSNLDFLAILEGRANKLDYGSKEEFGDEGLEVYYRGYIQFCCVGGTGTTKTGARFSQGVR